MGPESRSSVGKLPHSVENYNNLYELNDPDFAALLTTTID